MNAPLWTIKVQRVSPITGKTGWAKLFTSKRKRPPTWPTREEAARHAIAHHGFHAGRSKVVAVGGAP
jgi:hypothetical protein